MFWNLAEKFASGCMPKSEGFNDDNNKPKVDGSVLVLMLVIWVVVLFVLAPWLWNNILCRLVPAVKKSQWYDMFLLAILLSILLPARM